MASASVSDLREHDHAPGPEGPRRADAIRNRERVLAAAEAVFCEAGLEVSMEEIARRAGVGKATIYRSFPTKQHLIAGIAVGRIGQLEQMVVDASREDDAGLAFRHVVVAMAGSAVEDRVMLSVTRSQLTLPELEEARASLWKALGRLMSRGKDQGSLREDARPEDVRALLSGLTYTLSADEQRDAAVWARYANLVADALGAPVGSSEGE